MFKKPVGQFIAFMVFACLLIVSCLPAYDSTVKTDLTTKTKLRLALNTSIINPGIAYAWIGQDLGYFSEEGIELEVIPTSGTAEATRLIALGKADIGFPPPSSLLYAASEDQDLGLICVYLMHRDPVYEVVVLPESPIISLSDLKGKRIGVISLGDESVVFARALMTELGYPSTANEMIAVGTGVQAAHQLKQNRVDALIFGDIDRTLVEAQGIPLRALEAPQFADDIFGNQVVVRKDFLRANETAIAGYLRALAKSTLFTLTNPEAALRIHFSLYPETIPSQKTLDEAVEAYLPILHVRMPKLSYKDEKIPKWGANSIEEWKAYAEYIGLSDQVKLLDSFFTNDLIDQANDFDEDSIIRGAMEYNK